MAISEIYSGTETVTTTEHDLPSDTTSVGAITTDGVFQCFLELNNLAKADIYEFKVYEKVLNSSTQRVVYSVRFANAQTEPIWVSPSLVLIHGWTMSLNKISGTDRTIDWSIRSVA
jgi:hypothetical protein